MRRLRRRLGSLLGVLAMAVIATGCATGTPEPRSTPRVEPEGEPWALPTSAVGSQRLFRFDYSGPEGDGGGRLTLRVGSGESFRLDVSDRFGRGHWTIGATSGEAVWVDRDRRVFCRDPQRLPLPGLGGSPIAPTAVPRLLLGRVPAEPVSATTGSDLGAGRFTFTDAAGRRWRVRRDDAGAVIGWTLSVDGEPRWWWRRDGDGGVLSQRTEGRQLRWRRGVVEPLASPLAPVEIPADFTERCDVVGRL